MNKRLKRKVSFALAAFLAFMVAILILCMITEAKTGGMYVTSEGRYFSEEAGYFQIEGRTYYAYHSKSAMYEKGELATNVYRVRGDKLYYFGPDGAMVTQKTSRNRMTRYMDFNADGSIACIYPAGRGEPYERYNANRHRYQTWNGNEWTDTGMQCWPYGLIDWGW
jgi:hypothetical protein